MRAPPDATSPGDGRRVRLRPAWQAGLAGALSAAVWAPLDVLPALLAYGWLLALLLDAPGWRAAWRLAVLFVFAQALVGMHWIAVAFTVDIDRFGALAVPAVLLLALGIALIQGSVVSLLALRRWRSPLAAALVFAPLWLAGEALRSVIGQFPWNLVGYAFAGWPALAQGAAIGSVWWLGWLAVLAGTLPLAARSPPGERRAWLAASLVVAVALGGWGQGRAGRPEASTDTRLRLVQGAFALDHGFAPDRLRAWFSRQLELSAGGAAVDAVIWSEGASPYLLATDAAARTAIARMLAGVATASWLLSGGDAYVRDAAGRVVAVTNSLFAVDRSGTLEARYDKVDLVPFGEFLPVRPLLRALGLKKLTAGTLDYVRGDGRSTMRLAGLPPFSPLICYEAIFAGRAIGEPRPAWLLNVTIDTWFGRTVGPHQHLAMARMRAIEEGLPMIRVANSGLSAVITPLGHVPVRTALDEVTAVDVTLPAARPPTPFARWRWSVVIATSVAGLLLAVVLERGPRGRTG